MCVVGSLSWRRPSGSAPLGVPAPAPALPAQAAPPALGPRQRAPPAVRSRGTGTGWVERSGRLLGSHAARSPDCWTRRVRRFPGLQTGFQRGPADRAAGAVCGRGEAEGSAAGAGSPDPGFLQAALGPSQGALRDGRVSARAACEGRGVNAPAPRRGDRSCTCSRARAARRPFLPESEVPRNQEQGAVPRAAAPRSRRPASRDCAASYACLWDSVYCALAWGAESPAQSSLRATY